MCEIPVTDEMGASFVMYNLAFSGPRNRVLTASQMSGDLEARGLVMDDRAIELQLREWNNSGLLDAVPGGYCIA